MAAHRITDLLDKGVQPFPDLHPDDFEALRKTLGKHPLADPVSVTSDGWLIDGHQRLKALLANGRRTIADDEIRIVEAAKAANMWDYAVQLNVQRRHLTVEEKADAARKLQRERKWTQGRIAKAFGVSRPAVTQWLAKVPAQDGSQPDQVTGLDGRVYDTGAVSGRPGRPASGSRPQRPPWHPDGYAFKTVRKALTLLQSEPYGALPPLQEAKFAQLLDDVIEAAEALRNQVSED